jgi:hypothetical protein
MFTLMLMAEKTKNLPNLEPWKEIDLIKQLQNKKDVSIK